MYPSSLEKLIEEFKKLPSVGQKTAERYAMQVLELSSEEIEQFAQQLMEVKRRVKHCLVCGHLTEKDRCEICQDSSRDAGMICVVQQPKDVIAIEKLGSFHGVYHVLHGAISPMKGILPENLNMESLFARIDENTKEIILATNATLEGDTTALYITKRLKNASHITVSRLASGLPNGSNLDYADELTLMRALQGRIKQ